MGSSHSDDFFNKSWSQSSYKPVFSRKRIRKLVKEERKRTMAVMCNSFAVALNNIKIEASESWQWFQSYFECLTGELTTNARSQAAVNLQNRTQDLTSSVNQPYQSDGVTMTVSPYSETRASTRQKIEITERMAHNDEARKKLKQTLLICAPISPQEELKRILNYLLFHDYEHLIYTLIYHFKSRFKDKYSSELDRLDDINNSEKIKALYEEVCLIVKLFVRLANMFVTNLYSSYIHRMSKRLKEVDYSIQWIIDSLIYKALFSQIDSTLSELTFGLFRKINMDKIENFRRILQEKKSIKLEDNSSFVRDHFPFLLQNNQDPYKEAIDKITKIKSYGSPYKKFEAILSVERQILACAKQYYSGDPQAQRNLEDKFEMDVKFPIIIYCVIKSQYEDIIIDSAFIEEFVDKDCWDCRQNFHAFMGVVSVHLLGESED